MAKTQIFTAFLLLGVLLYSAEANPKTLRLFNPNSQGCASIECPLDKEDMYFPHPERCDAYCQCSNYVPYEVLCNVGLIFNPTIVPGPACDWPENYDCTIGQDDEPAQDCESINCPSDAGIQLSAHPSKCDVFCQCSNGAQEEISCASGLVYDPNVQLCVYPSMYECPYDVVRIFRPREWRRRQ